ncbi:dolichol kinase sec59 [Phanerochaete sordida]|uniref:dolichol kinase n=1 Tax=Phanerochaete sordida TaxID=48140 RepID=A0A9P3GGI5_9APHY|nr:dolichol kinase sec59 [Phanerochaete sordida]
MEQRRGTPVITASLNKKEERGYIWMTVPKNYRDSADDGILTGLLGAPFIAAAMLYLSMRTVTDPASNRLPPEWLIEGPRVHPDKDGSVDAAHALLISRRNLVSLSTFCATILIVHVAASRVTELRHRRKVQVPAGEVHHVPRKESRRTYLYVLFTVSVTLWILCVKIILAEFAKLGIWQNLSNTEIVAASVFYQFSLYAAVRLAHHGFTLGELGLVSFGATALFMEMMNLTISRILPSITPFIKTYRLPTPLLIYQLALIPGSLLTGFLLSPLLYLSRHIARRPVRRLRFPEEKQKHRRLLALGFYAGSVLIVGGLIGLWTRWCLGNRDPWIWGVFWLLEGRRPWARPALLAYWAALGSLSVAGWNRQLARNRRYRHRPMNSIVPEPGVVVPTSFDSSRLHSGTQAAALSDPSVPPSPSSETGPYGLSFPNLSNLPNLPNLSNLPQLANGANVATDLLDAADKHVPTLTLNARRKFFHGLAVLMFVPGVALDPAFAHLAFSAAFALFTFAEYVRYFALYPFGAAVHVFMNEFLDVKDSGTAILSHFYLLTGCANSVWFEGPSRLLLFTGILTLGVGDALASIVGKRLGRHRWSASIPKTIEGSAAFTLSVVACAWLLRICGFTEDFSIVRYGAVAVLASVLEAFSVQNDNLTLPLYMWSMLAFVNA